MAVDKRQGEDHYKQGGMEPIDYIEQNSLPFAEGCIVKYATRHAHKEAQEAVKDLYDIAIYAYLILKHRYKTGPMLDDRPIPKLTDPIAREWGVDKDGQLPTLSMPMPPTLQGAPVISSIIDNQPTLEQFNELHQLLFNRFRSHAPASFRAIVQAAIQEIVELREHTSIADGDQLWTPHTLAKIPAEAIRRKVHVMLANGEVNFGDAEVFFWDSKDLPECEQITRRIVAWRIS